MAKVSKTRRSRESYERLSPEEALQRSIENASKERKYATRLGAKILKLCWSRGWSQRRMSEEFPASSRSTVNRWVIGTGVPGPEELVLMSNKFGVSLDYLLRDEVDDPMGGLLSGKQREILALVEKLGYAEAEARLLGLSGPRTAAADPEPLVVEPVRQPSRSRRG